MEIFVEYLVNNWVENIVGVCEYFVDYFGNVRVLVLVFIVKIWLELEDFVG